LAPCSGGDQQSPIDINGAISACQPPLKISWHKRTGTIINKVLAAALWMTIDMDYPGGGMIRVSDRPVVEALAAMK
jgi:carbonic anhydrase